MNRSLKATLLAASLLMFGACGSDYNNDTTQAGEEEASSIALETI